MGRKQFLLKVNMEKWCSGGRATHKMVISHHLMHRLGSRRFLSRIITLQTYSTTSQPSLSVTCPIFSDDGFYIEPGIHPGIAAVELESFGGDDSAETTILPKLKKEHKQKSPLFSRFGKLLLNLYYQVSEELHASAHISFSFYFLLTPLLLYTSYPPAPHHFAENLLSSLPLILSALTSLLKPTLYDA